MRGRLASARGEASIMDDEEFFDEKVWEHEELWPRDRDGGVFLARVIAKIEKVMSAEPLSRPPEWRPSMTEAESDAIEDAETEYEAKRLRRRRQAVEQFVSGYKAGKFECVKVPKEGGEVQDLPVPNWFSQSCDHWFRFCDFSRQNNNAGYSDTNPWIFVTKASCQTYFGELAAPHVSPDGYYSPYLRLMMDATRELKLDPNNQPPVKEVIAKLRALWPKHVSGEITDDKLRNMATLVREIASEKRQYKKKD
jgi:hypothetical protein